MHDRSLRESGHDTSWRLDDVCADLNVVDLNALLYKYETDFEYMIDTYFSGKFKNHFSADWRGKAAKRKIMMDQLLWDEKEGSYFDYNFKEGKQTGFESVTNFYPLWAKCCSEDKAAKMVKILMRDFRPKAGYWPLQRLP